MGHVSVSSIRSVFENRAMVTVVLVAVTFILTVAFSVFSATTINDNVSTGGTLTVDSTALVSGAFKASSTVQATGVALFYSTVSAGASTNTPVTTFNVTGSEFLTGGLGIGYATTGAGHLLASGLGVFQSRLGVNASTSPAVEFGVTGSGLFSGGLGIGYATSDTGSLIASGLGVFQNRLGVNATTSPYQEFGVSGDVAAGSGATTSVSLESTSASQAGCIELKGENDSWVRIYPSNGGGTSTTAFNAYGNNLTSAGGGGASLLRIEAGRCQ